RFRSIQIKNRRRLRPILASVFAVPLVSLATISVNSPAMATDLYWDADADASNNDLGTGAGLGGTGTWDNGITSNWNDSLGLSDQTWNDANADNAIFWGTAGTVTINTGETRTASGLNFKTDAYTLTGGTVALMGGTGTINVDTGTATINSIV